jgi:hypothetical protein
MAGTFPSPALPGLTPVRSASRRKRWCFASGMRIVIVAVDFSPSLHEFRRRFNRPELISGIREE